MNISEAINKLMSERKENSYSLAKKVHIPQPTIYRITTGQTLDPKQENIDSWQSSSEFPLMHCAVARLFLLTCQ